MPDQPFVEEPGVPRWAFVGGVFALAAIALEVWGSWGTGADPRRCRRVATAVTALPFVAFAVGIAVGAAWTTWH